MNGAAIAGPQRMCNCEVSGDGGDAIAENAADVAVVKHQHIVADPPPEEDDEQWSVQISGAGTT